MLKIEILYTICIVLSTVLLTTDATKKRAMVGGWSPVPIDDEQLQIVAGFAVEEMARRSNSLFATRLVSYCSFLFNHSGTQSIFHVFKIVYL